MRTYKITGAVTTTANNIANIQMVRNGKIKGLRYALSVDAPADNAAFNAELSLQPVSQVGTSNTQGVIDEFRHVSNLTTSGAFGSANMFQRSLDFPISAGEVLYVNATATGTITATFTIFIDVQEG